MGYEGTQYDYFAPVRFETGSRNYFFGTNDSELKAGDAVVVQTANGTEFAHLVSDPQSTELYKGSLALSPILRKANEDDRENHEFNIRQSKTALKIAEREIELLGLPMRLLNASYTLDGFRITITYSSDGRVDFRELLHNLAPKLKCRIELRQLAPRDRAKQIGGMGPCGLPLCCSTFLNDFEGITIAKAKNQMLTLNIPKLSGQCGRLMCCLGYEDDIYTEEKRNFPRIGTEINTKEGDFKVDSYNILSRKIHISSSSESRYVTIEEYDDLLHGRAHKAEQTKNEFNVPYEGDVNQKPNEKNSRPNTNGGGNDNHHREGRNDAKNVNGKENNNRNGGNNRNKRHHYHNHGKPRT